jgi:hypothetical protein
VNESIFFDEDAALTKSDIIYVPLPDPGPPSTKNNSVGVGGHTLTSFS